MAGIWDQLVDCVCRPPRDLYTDEDLLGKSKGAFAVVQQNKTTRRCYRQDIELVNKRGKRLQCSHYKPNVVPTADGKLPCVIFCHCNSGSRRDAEEAVKELVPRNITVFCMDFEGSGLSDGEWVTLGANEVSDLAVVVDYLRHDDSTSYIGLWGRSMGAVTALLYSRLDPTIAGMVLDSPFSRLTDLMMELVEDQRIKIPKAMLKVAIGMLRRSVKKRANFSIDDVSPLDHCISSHIPALFAHGENDSFIKPHHSQRLFEVYSGPKELTMFEGDHNDPRPQWFVDAAYFFFFRMFQMERLTLLPQFQEYGLSESVVPSAGGRCASRASSASASEDVQYVDEWGGAMHGTPFHVPDAPSMLQQLAGAAAPDNEEEAMLQAALVASLQANNSAGDVGEDRHGAASPDQLDEEEQLRLAIEASLQDQQAREDFLFSNVAWQERNLEAAHAEEQVAANTPAPPAASNSTAAGHAHEGQGEMSYYQTPADSTSSAQARQAYLPTYSPLGRYPSDHPAELSARICPAGATAQAASALLDEPLSPGLAASRAPNNNLRSSQASSGTARLDSSHQRGSRRSGQQRSSPGRVSGAAARIEHTRPVPFREAHPSAQPDVASMVTSEAMLFSPGHHTAEELGLLPSSNSRSSGGSRSTRHMRSSSAGSASGLHSAGPAVDSTTRSANHIDLRSMLVADSMSSWAVSNASDDWALSDLVAVPSGLLSPTASARVASLDASVHGVDDAHNPLQYRLSADQRCSPVRQHSAAGGASLATQQHASGAVANSAVQQEVIALQEPATDTLLPPAQHTHVPAGTAPSTPSTTADASGGSPTAPAVSSTSSPTSPAQHSPQRLSPRQQAVLSQWEQYKAAKVAGAARTVPGSVSAASVAATAAGAGNSQSAGSSAGASLHTRIVQTAAGSSDGFAPRTRAVQAEGNAGAAPETHQVPADSRATAVSNTTASNSSDGGTTSLTEKASCTEEFGSGDYAAGSLEVQGVTMPLSISSPTWQPSSLIINDLGMAGDRASSGNGAAGSNDQALIGVVKGCTLAQSSLTQAAPVELQPARP